MLMRKQVLLPATKKAFDIRRDPFDELQSADDIFINADIRYVREAMHQVAMHDGFLAVIGSPGRASPPCAEIWSIDWKAPQ